MDIKGSLNKLLGSRSVKNGLWLYLLQIFNTVIPLLTLPYITRILGQAQYGVFSIALNLIGYLQVLIEYGFGMSATRKVALSKGDSESVSGIFSSVLICRLLLLGISTVIALGYVCLVQNNPRQGQCVMMLLLCLVGFCFQQDWLFQGLQDMKYISVLSMIARTASVVLVFLLVKSEADLLLYCFLYAVSPLLSGAIGTVLAVVKYKLRLRLHGFSEVWKELKDGWYVFTTSLSSKVFGAIGITFLGIFAAEAVVGAYSAIQKIPQIMMLAWAPISQVIYPITSRRMMQSYAEGSIFVKKLQRIFLLLFSAAAVFLGVLAKPIVTIAFGAEYAGSYYWLIPQLVWMVIAINNNFLGIQTLLSSGHDKEYSQCFQMGVVCTIVFNLVLIKLFGGFGAAVAPALSEAVLTVALILKIRKIQ